MATWRELAWQLQLTLLVPVAARSEALLAHPDDTELIDLLMVSPSVVVLDRPGAVELAAIRRLHLEDGVFDPLATWVVGLCRSRGWPALSSDPTRLRRVDADLAVDVL